MLPDIGASELMVIALVALIFVGPKDLPVMLRKLGQFTSKLRRMAADFRSSFDDMARQSELEDLRKEVEEMRARATDAVSDPIGIDSTLRETMDEIDMSITAPDEPYMTYDAEPIVAEEVVETPVKASRKTVKKAAAKAPAAKTAAPRKTAPSAPKSKATAAPRKRPATKGGS